MSIILHCQVDLPGVQEGGGGGGLECPAHPRRKLRYSVLSLDFPLFELWILLIIVKRLIFKHQYGAPPYNVALFFIFIWNTRTNLTNKFSVQIAGNGISGLQISKLFSLRPLVPHPSPPPPTHTHTKWGQMRPWINTAHNISVILSKFLLLD